MQRAWHCHCCGKLNSSAGSRCSCCGRSPSYTVAQHRPCHGALSQHMSPSQVRGILGGSEHEYDREAWDEAGFRPLHLACYYGQAEVVQALLQEKTALVDVRTKFNWTSLHLACGGGHVDVVKLLVLAGADLEAKTERESLTPLLIAARRGVPDIIDSLAEKGANVNAQDQAGRTALHQMVISCNTEALKGVCGTLLKYGADTTVLDEDGMTPMRFAELFADRRVCELFIHNNDV